MQTDIDIDALLKEIDGVLDIATRREKENDATELQELINECNASIQQLEVHKDGVKKKLLTVTMKAGDLQASVHKMNGKLSFLTADEQRHARDVLTRVGSAAKLVAEEEARLKKELADVDAQVADQKTQIAEARKKLDQYKATPASNDALKAARTVDVEQDQSEDDKQEMIVAQCGVRARTMGQTWYAYGGYPGRDSLQALQACLKRAFGLKELRWYAGNEGRQVSNKIRSTMPSPNMLLHYFRMAENDPNVPSAAKMFSVRVLRLEHTGKAGAVHEILKLLGANV